MADRAGQQLGNYHLLRLLGQGGFADVYLAEHLHLKTLAAVKVLNANLAARDVEGFLAEAQTVARLRHPHVIRVLEFGVEDGIPFLVMDYAPRGTLRARYPQGTRLHLATILPHVQQVAAALQFAHEHELVHRDVKPENMLLDARDAVLLSDFGTATRAYSSQSHQNKAIAGTVAYMAPEQLRGQPRPASDQYALGVVVYEWLVGERPFHGSLSEIASQQLFAPPPPLRAKLPALAPMVEEVVLTALAKDPKARFTGMQDFATALEHASQHAPESCSASLMLATPDRGNEVTLQAIPQPSQPASSAQTAAGEALRPRRHRPRPARSRVRTAALIIASLLPLAAALALALLLMTHSLQPPRLVNTSATAAATAKPPRTAGAPVATRTTTADANAPYAAAIPGPCDAASGARWTAVGTHRCLADALLVTRLHGNNDAGVYFSSSPPGGAALPLNYTLQVDVSHLQGNICVMVSSVFSVGNPTPEPQPVPDLTGALEVELCANQTLLVYRIPASTPIYAARIAPLASYSIAVSCAMPTCAIVVNDRRVASALYANVTRVSNIGLTVLGNDSARVAAGSAEFDHFLFTPGS